MNKKYKRKLKKMFFEEVIASSEYLIKHLDESFGVDDDYLKTLSEWEKLMDCAFDNIERFEKWEQLSE